MKEFNKVTGRVAGIETMGLVDGPGVRTVVFLQGCPLRCVYCHNPEMQENKSGFVVKYTPEELMEKLLRYKPYYKDNGGVTFSGGEPLLQSEFLCECVRLCEEEGINTAIDTSGAGSNYDEFLNYIDLVILDIKACNESEYKRITGGDFALFEKFLQACQEKKKPLWLRQVVVPGINDDEKHILELAQYISKIKYVERIELLPYHEMAKVKYNSLEREYPLEGYTEMDSDKCKKLEEELIKKIKQIRGEK